MAREEAVIPLKTGSLKMAGVVPPNIHNVHVTKFKASTPAVKPPGDIAGLLTNLKSVKTPYGAVVAKLANGWVAKYPEMIAGRVISPTLMFGYGSSWTAQDLKDAIGLFNAKELENSKTGVLFGIGSVAGILNIAKIEQERSYNVTAGYSCFAGIVNTGKISQEGEFNLQVGIGGLLGVVNLGAIKTEGTSVFIGLSNGAGILNAGSINLTEGASGTIGAGAITGILNLGTIKTGDNADVVAGISGGAGIVNGLSPASAAAFGITSGSLAPAVISTGAGDDLVAGSGLYNLAGFLDSQAPAPTYQFPIGSTNSLAGILTPELINDLKLDAGVDLAALIPPNYYSSYVTGVSWTPVVAASVASPAPNAPLDNAKDATFGIINFGSIDVGTGNDTIFGAADDIIGEVAKSSLPSDAKYIGSGVLNGQIGTILLGEGNDTLRGETWSISAPTDPLSPSAGIVNFGTIDAGNGNDFISGYSGTCTSNPTNIGILNKGLIKTGAGDDTVDALTGGFSGSGLTDLGEGNDTLIGFGTGRFDGGGGFSASQKDTLLLASGTYVCSLSSGPEGFFSLSQEDPVTHNSTTMLLQGFELIGAAANPSSAINFFTGQTYEVLGGNISSYATPIPAISIPL